MMPIYQFRFLKVASIRKMAKSATDSEEAAALEIVSHRESIPSPTLDIPVAVENSCSIIRILLKSIKSRVRKIKLNRTNLAAPKDPRLPSRIPPLQTRISYKTPESMG